MIFFQVMRLRLWKAKVKKVDATNIERFSLTNQIREAMYQRFSPKTNIRTPE